MGNDDAHDIPDNWLHLYAEKPGERFDTVAGMQMRAIYVCGLPGSLELMGGFVP